MKMKTFQILLVVAAVLCAAGIAPTLFGERDTDMSEDYTPPAWISALEGIASKPVRPRDG